LPVRPAHGGYVTIMALADRVAAGVTRDLAALPG